MKPIKYARHAKNRMRWHKISEEEVVSVLQSPDFLEPSIEGRFNAWRKASDKFLRVTYKEDAEKYFVVTAGKKKKDWR
ncbi:MAG: DUF4258 domain-containing protein [Deltaproteobacteria bacterium]|nr:DUF4258 domain-containing protein [Deltaproteobacteria bacterium]